MTDSPAPEFSRPIRVDSLADEGSSFAIEANEGERAALAHRFDLLRLDAFAVTGTLTPLSAGRVRLQGRLTARYAQACVVTLVPVPAEMDLAFERLFDPAVHDEWGETPEGEEWVVSLEQEPLAEPLPGGTIDVGEVGAQALGLEINPFPRAAGAVFSGYASGEDPLGDHRANAFAALAARAERTGKGR